MHERTIALSLVEAVCDGLPALGCGVRIVALHLRIGPLSPVVAETLALSFDEASAGSPIEGARLDIERTPLVIWCDRCVAERTAASVHQLSCPICGSSGSTIMTGQQLELTAVEVMAPPS